MMKTIYLKLRSNSSGQVIYVQVKREETSRANDKFYLKQTIKFYPSLKSYGISSDYSWNMCVNESKSNVNLAYTDAILPDELWGKGLGSFLFNYFVTQAKQDPNFAVDKLEWSYVDADPDSDNPIEKEKFARREKFYLNFGIKFVHTDGIKPNISHESLPMKCSDLKTLHDQYFINRGIEEIHDPENCFVYGQTIQKFFGD